MTLTTAISGPTPWRKLTKPLPATTTTVVDTEPETNFKGMKYIVTLSSETNSLYRKLDIDMVKSSTDVTHSISNKVFSGSMDIEISATINAGNLELTIVNNESFSLDLTLAKLRQN